MLVLTRKVGESVIIGDEIVVTILKVEGNSVKIGIEAPKNIKILRKELYEDVKRINLEASKVSKEDLKEVWKDDKGHPRTGTSP